MTHNQIQALIEHTHIQHTYEHRPVYIHTHIDKHRLAYIDTQHTYNHRLAYIHTQHTVKHRLAIHACVCVSVSVCVSECVCVCV